MPRQPLCSLKVTALYSPRSGLAPLGSLAAARLGIAALYSIGGGGASWLGLGAGDGLPTQRLPQDVRGYLRTKEINTTIPQRVRCPINSLCNFLISSEAVEIFIAHLRFLLKSWIYLMLSSP